MEKINKKIAVIFPHFKRGGGDVVVVWAIEALMRKYDVYLVTLDKIDISLLNSVYGTHLSQDAFKVVNPFISFLIRIIPGLGLLKYHILIRYLNDGRQKFDVVLGMHKEADLGQRGIQYVYFPEMEQYSHELDFFSKIYYTNSFLRKLYKNFCYLISGHSNSKMRLNVTLTDSYWTKRMIKKIMGIDSIVVYPPVLDDFVKTSWNEREDGFVCIGRISKIKRIDMIITILALVRKAGLKVHLHIIGPVEEGSYYRELVKIQKKNPWISIEGFVDRKTLVSMVSKHKYGIHGRRDEHFGIAVAEMAKAGCIVFVPNDGGQTEIVGTDELIFKKEKDAAEKIKKVLTSTSLQLKLLDHLKRMGTKFSTEFFKDSFKKIVDDFLRTKSNV